jgi:phosphoribosylformylglycinamidine synthase
LAGAAAVIEGALNVACSGATPIGITNCLNFGSPEDPAGYWQLAEAVGGMADASRLLGVPIVSGNVSLYNQAGSGSILPTPVIGMVGLLDDRSRAVAMRWRPDDEIWLLGSPAWDASALAASELAWRRGRFGGEPSLDVAAGSRLVALLNALSGAGRLSGAHDLSVGGLALGLARLAIASSLGASIELPPEAATLPCAALFGERTGRVVVAVRREHGAELVAAADAGRVETCRLGIAGGDRLRVATGSVRITCAIEALRAAWETPF